MAALVRHFGDVEDASRRCGICDVCDPAGAVLRLFRRATAEERARAQRIADELRPVDYKPTGGLQRSLDPDGRLSRNEFDGLLGAMEQARLIEMEEAEYEKEGEVRRFRKVRLTEMGLEFGATSPLPLLIAVGIVEEFGGDVEQAAKGKKSAAGAEKSAKADSVKARSGGAGLPKPAGSRGPLAAARLTAEGEALAARIREWRAAEARRLRRPAYVVLHDRTLTALAQAGQGMRRVAGDRWDRPRQGGEIWRGLLGCAAPTLATRRRRGLDSRMGEADMLSRCAR